MTDTERTDPIEGSASIARMRASSSVTALEAPLPRWRVCRRCGHLWRSRSRGLRFRCRACEEHARAEARAASAAARRGQDLP
jgi:tRNA(Ile2) C34 agmatinyltransferase TiaS